MERGREEMEKEREKKIENRAKRARIKETEIPPLCRKTNEKTKKLNIFIQRFYTVSDKEILKSFQRDNKGMGIRVTYKFSKVIQLARI